MSFSTIKADVIFSQFLMENNWLFTVADLTCDFI